MAGDTGNTCLLVQTAAQTEQLGGRSVRLPKQSLRPVRNQPRGVQYFLGPMLRVCARPVIAVARVVDIDETALKGGWIESELPFRYR